MYEIKQGVIPFIGVESNYLPTIAERESCKIINCVQNTAPRNLWADSSSLSNLADCYKLWCGKGIYEYALNFFYIANMLGMISQLFI